MTQENNQQNGKDKCNFSHLTLKSRKIILEELLAGSNQKQIAEKINCHKVTVSRELLRNRTLKHNNRSRLNNTRHCAYVQACKVHNLCSGKDCIEPCKECYYNKICTEFCPDFKRIECKRHDRFPYVCDGCKKLRSCTLPTWYRYIPDEADKISRNILVTTRQGIDMSPEDFAKLDKAIISGTKNGQSIEHIIASENFNVTARTVRNYVNNGLTTTQHDEMPRGAVFKPRVKHSNKTSLVEIKRAKEGRGYSDFLRYANETPFLFYAELDTVEGSLRTEDRSRLVTIIRPRSRLFLCFKVDDGKQSSVNAVIDRLYEQLGHDDFVFMFGTLLTDNGSEFSNPLPIECNSSGDLRCHLFYCHPYSSWEKGAIENCHELLRRIVPKGSSLKNITVSDTYLINSHINSYTREENGNESAYLVFCNTFGNRGKSILRKLHVSYIDSKDVNLTPKLLQHDL